MLRVAVVDTDHPFLLVASDSDTLETGSSCQAQRKTVQSPERPNREGFILQLRHELDRCKPPGTVIPDKRD